MKKLLAVSFAFAMLAGVVSCNKVSPTPTGSNTLYTTPTEPLDPSNPLYPVGYVPRTFTKKAILEEITGEWCGACPGGAEMLHTLTSKYPNTVYAVAFHEGDPYEVTASYDGLKSSVFAPGGLSFPAASVNRRLTISQPDYADCALDLRNNWETQLVPVLKETAKCGLALVANEDADNVDLDVFVGYNSPINEATNITVYVVEDNLKESAPGAQTSGGGTAANPYEHNHVVLKTVSASNGDPISLTEDKNYYKKVSYHFNIAGLYNKKDNVKIVVLVNKTASSVKDINVLNVQQVALDEVKKWD